VAHLKTRHFHREAFSDSMDQCFSQSVSHEKLIVVHLVKKFLAF
jgi:hypothetical protein